MSFFCAAPLACWAPARRLCIVFGAPPAAVISRRGARSSANEIGISGGRRVLGSLLLALALPSQWAAGLLRPPAFFACWGTGPPALKRDAVQGPLKSLSTAPILALSLFFALRPQTSNPNPDSARAIVLRGRHAGDHCVRAAPSRLGGSSLYFLSLPHPVFARPLPDYAIIIALPAMVVVKGK